MSPARLVAQFHAYVLGYIIGVRWGTGTPTCGIIHSEVYDLIKEYLIYAHGEEEWSKMKTLDALRYKSRTEIKKETRLAFPSLFPLNKRAKPFDIPDEIKKESVKYDLEKIQVWKSKIESIKMEDEENMETNENDVEGDVAVNQAEKKATRSKVNFTVPPSISLDQLTVDNYRELTGHRYRMTQEQKGRGLSREQAFEESKALAAKEASNG